MRGKVRKFFTGYFIPIMMVILISTLFSLQCDARGSGTRTTRAPTAGYKSGNYSAPKTTTKGTTTRRSTTSTTAVAGTTEDTTGGTTTGGSTTKSSSISTTTGGSKTVVVLAGGTTGATNANNSTSGGGGAVAIVIIIIVVVAVVIFVRMSKKKHGDNSMEQYAGESFDVTKELAHYKELYAALVLGIDDVHDYIDKADLDKRRCVRLLPVLNEYIGMLEKALGDGKRKVSPPESLIGFRTQHREELEKLRDCTTCKCLKCARDCNMSGCSRCEPGFRCKVASCNNKTSAVYVFENREIELANGETGENENLKVLAVVEDLECKQLYIILERNAEKIIMYYYPGIDGDKYGEITDTEDLEFAVKAYESIHLS